MLDEAPAEHHFFDQERPAANKAYMNRVQKEHRALMSSLPGMHHAPVLVFDSLDQADEAENILVRAYEDRLDLLRVLIFGPDGTPYNDAPFVFDVHLDPAKFPHDPPSVYFHSHTMGHGRCNRESRWREPIEARDHS
jgi:ubiquitin-conjugating enzyme E2 O